MVSRIILIMNTGWKAVRSSDTTVEDNGYFLRKKTNGYIRRNSQTREDLTILNFPNGFVNISQDKKERGEVH